MREAGMSRYPTPPGASLPVGPTPIVLAAARDHALGVLHETFGLIAWALSQPEGDWANAERFACVWGSVRKIDRWSRSHELSWDSLSCGQVIRIDELLPLVWGKEVVRSGKLVSGTAHEMALRLGHSTWCACQFAAIAAARELGLELEDPDHPLKSVCDPVLSPKIIERAAANGTDPVLYAILVIREGLRRGEFTPSTPFGRLCVALPAAIADRLRAHHVHILEAMSPEGQQELKVLIRKEHAQLVRLAVIPAVPPPPPVADRTGPCAPGCFRLTDGTIKSGIGNKQWKLLACLWDADRGCPKEPQSVEDVWRTVYGRKRLNRADLRSLKADLNDTLSEKRIPFEVEWAGRGSNKLLLVPAPQHITTGGERRPA